MPYTAPSKRPVGYLIDADNDWNVLSQDANYIYASLWRPNVMTLFWLQYPWVGANNTSIDFYRNLAAGTAGEPSTQTWTPAFCRRYMDFSRFPSGTQIRLYGLFHAATISPGIRLVNMNDNSYIQGTTNVDISEGITFRLGGGANGYYVYGSAWTSLPSSWASGEQQYTIHLYNGHTASQNIFLRAAWLDIKWPVPSWTNLPSKSLGNIIKKSDYDSLKGAIQTLRDSFPRWNTIPIFHLDWQAASNSSTVDPRISLASGSEGEPNNNTWTPLFTRRDIDFSDFPSEAEINFHAIISYASSGGGSAGLRNLTDNPNTQINCGSFAGGGGVLADVSTGWISIPTSWKSGPANYAVILRNTGGASGTIFCRRAWVDVRW